MEEEKDSQAFVLQALTRRELSILVHLANGRSSQEIALLETLAHSSVKWYIHQVYVKLGVNNRRQAVALARQQGLLQSEPVRVITPAAVKNNLPVELTHFFGREAEIPQIEEHLAEWRLVTLTGSGGVGKTRLSLAVAGKMLANFPEGVWFIELAPVTDPELVPAALASALCLHEESSRPILERVKSFLATRSALLLLDNCEHLLDACARLADSLLHACPQIRILATSREPLGVTGEAIFNVPSLIVVSPV